MASETSPRNALSPSAARCSALPWPYWCSSSAGRTATRTANSVSSAATRSVAEWAASATKASDPVSTPVASLTQTRKTAAADAQARGALLAALGAALRTVGYGDRGRRQLKGSCPGTPSV